MDLLDALDDAPEPQVDLRASILEQIRRDTLVLSEDPMFHEPSKEFFEERIVMMRKWYQELGDA